MPAPRRPRNFRRNRRNRSRYPRRKKAPVATKKDLMNLRSTLVETKAYKQKNNGTDDSGAEKFLISATAPGTALINACMYGFNQGVRDYDITGDEITMKYLTQKLSFRFPADDKAIVKPYRLQVIWGFIERPAGFTPFDEVAGNGDPADPGTSRTISRKQWITRMTKMVTAPWNEKEDFIDFRTKQKTLYKVIGKRWVKPNRNNAIPMATNANASSGSLDGCVPDVNMSISWPVKGHKYRLTYSDDSNWPGQGDAGGSAGVANPFWYVNEGKVPFTIIYAPDCDNITYPATDDYKVECTHNCKLWFTDS